MNKISQTIKESEKSFEDTTFAKGGGSCFECCDYESMYTNLKFHLLQSQIKLIEMMIEEMTQKKELRRGPYLGIMNPHDKGFYQALEDQISSLTEVLNELKNV